MSEVESSPWREVWAAAARTMPTRGLEALAEALRTDDITLCQERTCVPWLWHQDGYRLAPTGEVPVEACCPLAFPLWKGHGFRTVGQVEAEVARLRAALAKPPLNDLGLPQATQHLCVFQAWVDATPREEMFRLLLPEVLTELTRRGGGT